ncbi:hypothetical protein C8R45DRAFT_929062 [Mycena sanguinolenta]|nr:hypothetical protein C8R45DRAFT_929062 [Mycena sanguinolenta]
MITKTHWVRKTTCSFGRGITLHRGNYRNPQISKAPDGYRGGAYERKRETTVRKNDKQSLKRTIQEPALCSFNVFSSLNEEQARIQGTENYISWGNPARLSHLAFMEYDLLCCGVYREVRAPHNVSRLHGTRTLASSFLGDRASHLARSLSASGTTHCVSRRALPLGDALPSNLNEIAKNQGRSPTKVQLNYYEVQSNPGILPLDGFPDVLNSPLVKIMESIRPLDISGDTETRSTPYLNKLMPQLPVFPSLERLRVSSVYWTYVTAPARAAFATLVGNITDLDIHFVTFESASQMVDLVAQCTHLRKLSLFPSLQGEDTELPACLPAVPRALEMVRFRAQSNSGDPGAKFAAWLNTAGPPRGIRSLEMGVFHSWTRKSVGINSSKTITLTNFRNAKRSNKVTKMARTLGGLLRTLGPGLHDLDLALSRYVSRADVEKHIDLARNTALRRLTTHIRLHRPNPRVDTTVNTFEVFDDFEWERLNSTLETRAELAGLQRLEFVVYCYTVEEDLEAEIRRKMSGYDARGMVEVYVRRNDRIFTERNTFGNLVNLPKILGRRMRRMYNRGGPNQEQTAAAPAYKGLYMMHATANHPIPSIQQYTSQTSDRIPLTKRTG